MGWTKNADGTYTCRSCRTTFPGGHTCDCDRPDSASDPAGPVPTTSHTGPAGLHWFLRADEQWMHDRIDPAAEHLFSRAGRMIALGQIYLRLDHEGIESIDVKRADAQIKAINAIEKLDSSRAIEQRMDAIETALADMAALIASNTGSASRINMETPTPAETGGGTDPRN